MDKFNNYLETRKGIYNLLSYWYYMEVDKKFLDDVRDTLPFFRVIAENSKDNNFIESCNTLSNLFDNGKFDDKTIDDLACEFAKLFLITSKDAGIKSITAHESVYLSESKMMMQDERDEVLRLYCEEGVGLVDEVFKEPEDHISAELFFLSKMSEDCIKAVDEARVDEVKRNLNVQYNFINQHTIKWIDQLTADVVSSTQYDFYKAMATITAQFIHLDFIELGEILSEVENVA